MEFFFLIKLQAEHLQHCIVVVYIQRRIHNPAENLRWSFSTVKLHLRCSTGFWMYISDVLVKNAAEKNESFAQYNTKSRHVWKKAAIWMGLLTNQISLKIFLKYFLLILGVAFLVPSQYFFPKLQLHITKKCEIILFALRFYWEQLKKRVSDFKILFHKLETETFLSFFVSFMSNIFK